MDKIFSIQILRGIAALFVVCFHFRYAVNDIYAQKDIGNRLFEFGSFGVDLFFIISGFIMAMSARKNENLSEFFIKRFFRIYPLYFAVLTLYILLSFNEYSLPQIIKSYLLVPIDYKSEMPYYGYSIMAIAWTLTYEFWFYFILFLVFQKNCPTRTNLLFHQCFYLLQLFLLMELTLMHFMLTMF